MGFFPPGRRHLQCFSWYDGASSPPCVRPVMLFRLSAFFFFPFFVPCVIVRGPLWGHARTSPGPQEKMTPLWRRTPFFPVFLRLPRNPSAQTRQPVQAERRGPVPRFIYALAPFSVCRNFLFASGRRRPAQSLIAAPRAAWGPGLPPFYGCSRFFPLVPESSASCATVRSRPGFRRRFLS